ncbi:hypothetical protein [Tumebacillus flagellatus]|uniref:Uncharacterized protein n=1 Tax=Tumebacillus flagellatus TaxID=1157490 RepID=A0A074LNH0_9BACL|nr:hypothetical protein [Tumebacillus flagellatus]KEO83676.1 hypothetical protein EL26_08460 [Tumebacillus flagellatus]
MNPGVQANIITLVLIILVLSGWGERVLRDANISPRTAAVGLLLYVLADGFSITLPQDVHLDAAGLLLPLCLTALAMRAGPNAGARVSWWIGCLTISSVTVVLMTLVPLDPAFFPLEGPALYPVAAALVSVVSVRRPFFAVSMAVMGLALGTVIDPWLHARVDVHTYLFGGREMQDWMAFAAMGVLLTHYPYNAAVRLLTRFIRLIFKRREEGPESV